MVTETKEEIARQIETLLGIPHSDFSTGSTEPKVLFQAIIQRLRLPISPSLKKEVLPAKICALAGVSWDESCWSRGATVTRIGLERLLEAVPILAAQRNLVLVATPEVEDAEEAIQGLADPRRTGQGIRVPAEVRRAIENYSMERAQEYFESQDWKVEDVSASNPYDLHCTRRGETRHVEVKGTQSLGMEVFLTRGEVEQARDNYPDTALVVVSEIVVVGESAFGGKLRVWDPWQVLTAALVPLAFRYVVPPPSGPATALL